MASRAAENDLTLFDQDLNDTVEYEDLSMETSNTIVVFTPHVPVFFWPRRHNF